MAKKKPNRTDEPSRRRKTAAVTPGPAPLAAARLKRLPQHGDTWQADCLQLPMYVQDNRGEPARPWITLIVSFGQQLILGQHVSEEQPSPEQLWDTLTEAMQKPLMGDKQRPAELQVRAGVGWETLHQPLQELDIRTVTAEEFPAINQIVEHLAQSLGSGEQPSGLMDVPGVTAEQVGQIYEAAAEFYKQAPWRRLRYESAIRIDGADIEGGPWFAVLMGQAGLTKGVALYDDFDLLKRLWMNELSDEENAELTVATTVTFGDADETAAADVEAAGRHGWKVAGTDAYPSIFHKDRGMSMRPPSAEELVLMEASLRALPTFVKRRRQNDGTPERIAVSTAAGERTLTLAWQQTD